MDKKYRIKNTSWIILFAHKDNGWNTEDLGSLQKITTMMRDILDAKANRTHELAFSKNPHVAQMARLAGLKLNGTKINLPMIVEKIIGNI
ncbi:MAG: hypothetical protein WA063_02200 [Minisyncoccia bacterium]